MRRSTPSAPRRAAHVTRGEDRLAEGRPSNADLSHPAEDALARAAAARRAELWLAENSDALASSNAYVVANGLPLARYRGV